MKKLQSCLALLALILMGYSASLRAEDIDIYVENGANSAVPNVLLVMDTGANFSSTAPVPCTAYGSGGAPSLGNTAGGVEQCALVDAIESLPDSSVNIGILVNNNNGFGTDIRSTSDLAFHETCSGTYGGCVIRQLTLMDAANKTSLINFIKSWKTSGGNTATEFNIKSGGDRTANMMQEAWAYYNGKVGMSTKNYGTSIVGSGCQKNFVIFIGNTTNNAGGPADTGTVSPFDGLHALTSAQVGATDAQKVRISETVNFSPQSCGATSLAASTNANNWSQNWADEWARLMFQQDNGSSTQEGVQNIVTYTIGVVDPNNQCKPDYPAVLSTMAKYGGGKYFRTGNASEVKAALTSILNEVQAVNSVFSSASLPVSVNGEGTFLNQIYMGMFRPNASVSPRWLGNLKQYRAIKTSSGTTVLGDAANQPALSSAGTGFISPNAVSFWTKKDTSQPPDSEGGFWKNDLKGVLQSPYDSPDGEVVEKGGAAQQLRLQNLTATFAGAGGSNVNPRAMYTYCPTGSSCNASLAHASNEFSTANSGIAATAFGPSTDRDTVIKWVRGADNFGDEKGPGSSVTVRPSIHGDVLHSRPLVVNYGDSRGVVVFYGSNDGVFHAVNGSQADSIGTVPPGGELWGLVLREHFSKLNRQRVASPDLKFPSTSSATAQTKDYFVDGPTGTYQQLTADGVIDKAYLFLTMRRGGRMIYAMDVSTPTAPTVLWKIDNTTAGFSELGQTWSRPRVTLLQMDAAATTPTPVLIFGAGYDSAQDTEPPGTDSMGRGIYIVNALTGALIWSANSSCTTSATCLNVPGMTYAIPSDIAFIDRNGDGYTDKLYFGDLGGNVWRADVHNGTKTSWTVTKLAALGCATGVCAAGTAPRKFFFAPAVLSPGASGAVGSFDAVSLSSGDREHPLKNTAAGSSYNVTDRFFMIMDTGTSLGTPVTNNVTLPTLFNATSTVYDGTLNGFYVNFATGEKGVNAPLALSGFVFFATNRPIDSSASCVANLGEAKAYAVSPFSAAKATNVLAGGGLPPGAVAGLITIDGTTQKFCIGCGISELPGVSGDSSTGGSQEADCKSGVGICPPPAPVPKSLRRTYWYIK